MMMKHSNLMVAFLVTLLSLPSMMYAQKEFTLEDLNFGGKNYHNMVPENRYLTWWGDELIRNDAQACYLVDKETGEETQLFTLDEIAGMTQSSEQNRMRHLYNASFPKGGETVVALINGQERILLNWKSGECKKYNRDKVDAEDWCAASGMMAVVKDHNLFVVDDQGKKSQFSTDGSREIVYGQSVHRDEFGIEKGTFWSPDGKRLAFYRMDQSMVSDYPQVDIFNRVATYQPDKYPMAGETSHQVTVGVYDTTNDKTVYLQAGDPTDRYFTNIAWSPDSKVIYMFELNRDQNDCRLTSYDVVSGKPLGELYQEKNDKYVEPLHPIVFLPWDSNKFIFQSQRDGFNHLYLYDLKKKAYSQLTHGRWVVMELLGFNTKDKSVVIASNECSPIQRNLFSVDIKTGKRKLLDNGRGYHAGVLSESGLWLYDKYSEPDVPRNINVCHTTTAKNIQIMSAKDPWQGYQVPEYCCGTIKAADGTTDLYYRMVKPVHFDPTKKYPTVIYVYGGPHAHNVDARWH